MKHCINLLKKGGILSFVVSDTWRTLGSHKPLRAYILETCKINRLIKLNRYAFKTYGRNIDAFTIIFEFEKNSKSDNSSYFYYDFWQVHPLNEKKYFTNLIRTATYPKENNEWPFDIKRTYRYETPQKIVKNSEELVIFEGSPEIFGIFDKNAEMKSIEVN